MKIALVKTLCVAAVALAPCLVSAQTQSTTTVTVTPASQAELSSQAADQLLRNPEELYRRLDANADGVLSLTEFARISALADGATTGRPGGGASSVVVPGAVAPGTGTATGGGASTEAGSGVGRNADGSPAPAAGVSPR